MTAEDSESLQNAAHTYVMILAERGFRLRREPMSATRAFLATFPPTRAGRDPYRCLVINDSVKRSEMPELLLHMLSHVLLGHDGAYGTIVEREFSVPPPRRLSGVRDRLWLLRYLLRFVLGRRDRDEWARVTVAVAAPRDDRHLHQEASDLASAVFLGKAHVGTSECRASDTCPYWLKDERTLGHLVELGDVVGADRHPRLRLLLRWHAARPFLVVGLRLARLAYTTLRSHRAPFVPVRPPKDWRERMCLAEAVNSSPRLMTAANWKSALSIGARSMPERDTFAGTGVSRPVPVEWKTLAQSPLGGHST